MSLDRRKKFVIVLFLIAILTVLSVFVSANAQSNKETTPVVKLPRLVDVGADKCVPCIMMAPELEKLKKEYAGALEVEFVDAWKKPHAAESYKVRGIPTQIFYDATGKELSRHLGFISKEQILDTFRKMGIELKKPGVQSKR